VTVIRLRTLVTLFLASTVVTIGLRAAGAFSGDRVREVVRREIGQMEHVDISVGEGSRSELPVTLLRATPVTDEFVWAGIPAGKALEIRTLLGTIEAARASGDSVRVLAVREGDGRGDVQVRAFDRGNRITVCASHPSSDADGVIGCGTAVPSANGRKHMRSDARVNFRVELPRGMRLIARAVDGGIQLQGLESDVDVSTVNGNVVIQTTGAAEAVTVNGDIEAAIGRLTAQDNAFKTVNGSVTLLLPQELGAMISAASVTGKVNTDLPIQVRESKRSKLSGTLGAGGPELSVKTVAGDVQLKRIP
jgi:hypothetical protein